MLLWEALLVAVVYPIPPLHGDGGNNRARCQRLRPLFAFSAAIAPLIFPTNSCGTKEERQDSLCQNVKTPINHWLSQE
jgi:hypothetical protein